MIEKYENQSFEELARLLVNDKLTFSVLGSILGNSCKKIITNHKDFILCYSCSPYPVWIWTPDNASSIVYDTIYKIINCEFPKDDRYKFNMKYECAQYLINQDLSNEWYITTNMLTYDCPIPIAPTKQVEGSLCVAAMEDYDAVKEFVRGVFEATSTTLSNEECEITTKQRIKTGNLYLWKDGRGKVVAMCYLDLGLELGKVTLVYTDPTERRKGYAARMIYEVSSMMIKKGLLPILYTDGDYKASNECYKGVGYIERGCLCTVTRRKG
ncbi:MAG: family acetyltransferase [Herbinix sp.]|jgi:predicted GNAT family acetyltransferase|nr:family acetyltransferase [Herbinix sp.]